MSLARYAAVRVATRGIVVSLSPEGAVEVGRFPLHIAPGITACPGLDQERWVGLEQHAGGMRLVLEEQSSYIARVESSERDIGLFGLHTQTKPPLTIASGTGVFRVSTGNLVGLTRLVVGPVGPGAWPGLPVRIRVRKLGDPDRDFEWMVDDIVSAVRSLALTVAAPTALGIVRSSRGRSFAYEDLVFLRSIARDVDRVMDRITRRPHFRMASRTMTEDASRAAEIDPAGLVQLAADVRALALAPSLTHQSRVLSGGAAKAMTFGNRHWIPVRVPAVRHVVDHDTFENRFVRFVLEAFRDRCHAIAVAARASRRPFLATEADALAVRFGSWLRRSPFDEVGRLRGLTMTSQVLLREDNYNALLRRYREFLLTSDVSWDGFEFLQQSRDVAKLYEMWVFIQAVRAVASFADPVPSRSADSLLRVDSSGLVVNLQRGTQSAVRFALRQARISVTYDRTFSGSNADPRPSARPASYSLALRPDVSIEMVTSGGRRRGFVDAKYRVDRLPRVFEDPASVVDEDEDAEPGTFNVDDLNKMHTYRDAIGGSCFAVAAYPGHATRLFPRLRDEFARSGGVGAVALRPDPDHPASGFAGILRQVVEDALTHTPGSSGAYGPSAEAASRLIDGG